MEQKSLREQCLYQWVNQQLNNYEQACQFELISGDASFRRYYRVTQNNQYFIAVDAPPATENNPLFIELAQILHQHDIATPEIIAADLTQGFMLQSDLGDLHLANIINAGNYSSLYPLLWSSIYKIQNISKNLLTSIDKYNKAFVLTELAIFSDWFVEHYLAHSLTNDEKKLLEETNLFLTQQFLSQPQVAVHRDFHSRNIMLKAGDINQPLIIDFQGMLIGPICYDLVSLLKDCYLVWPQQVVNQLSEDYRSQYYPNIEAQQWQTWFDLTGLQRHLKCAGIFTRLALRDNKTGYLKHLADVVNYIRQAAGQYPELKAFSDWFDEVIYPEFIAKQAAENN
ncbi:phosphotransferase [Catenovulum sp. 2E275]|uniref:aminoglycoside phosphotransferase family protein n=1 Tax=Catenovulum sp. 2E275 TaxID=2980497 RepID=UPI0021D288AB|nr:phosphotransferase [Catenovulum sp. 2E275]MCU4675091.1 phosphotransferase [Catenovulum sp. 2E275]